MCQVYNIYTGIFKAVFKCHKKLFLAITWINIYDLEWVQVTFNIFLFIVSLKLYEKFHKLHTTNSKWYWQNSTYTIAIIISETLQKRSCCLIKVRFLATTWEMIKSSEKIKRDKQSKIRKNAQKTQNCFANRVFLDLTPPQKKKDTVYLIYT